MIHFYWSYYRMLSFDILIHFSYMLGKVHPSRPCVLRHHACVPVVCRKRYEDSHPYRKADIASYIVNWKKIQNHSLLYLGILPPFQAENPVGLNSKFCQRGPTCQKHTVCQCKNNSRLRMSLYHFIIRECSFTSRIDNFACRFSVLFWK